MENIRIIAFDYHDEEEDRPHLCLDIIFYLDEIKIGNFLFSSEMMGDFYVNNHLTNVEKRQIINTFYDSLNDGSDGIISFKQSNGEIKIEKIGEIVSFHVSGEMYECNINIKNCEEIKYLFHNIIAQMDTVIANYEK